MSAASDENVPRVAIQIVQGCLVAPLQMELYEATLGALRTDLLDAIRDSEVLRVVLDLSGVRILDRFAFEHLRETRTMCELMGAVTAWAGVRAAVAACVVDLGVDLRGMRIEPDVETALRRFNEPTPPRAPGHAANLTRPSVARPRLQDSGHDPLAQLLGRGPAA